MRLQCLCLRRDLDTESSLPAPLHPTPPQRRGRDGIVCACTAAGKMMRLQRLCLRRNMDLMISPHPTAQQRGGRHYPTRQREEVEVAMLLCAQEHGRYYPTHPAPLHPRDEDGIAFVCTAEGKRMVSHIFPQCAPLRLFWRKRNRQTLRNRGKR